MYHSIVIKRRLTAAFAALNKRRPGPSPPEIVPSYHTPSECQAARRHLEKARDPETGNLVRKLDADELAWIRNERILCQCDFPYYQSRYAHIRDWRDRVSLIVPNIAQKMIISIWGEMELAGNAILMLQLKARRLGISTEWELATSHRTQFYSNINAVVASSDPEKSGEMAKIMELCWDHMPWWLMPTVTARRADQLIEFGRQNSAVSIQHGTQFSGIARGATPSVFHLSELPDFSNPEDLIDASLLRAVIDSPSTFGGLESTAAGRGNWLHKKWKFAVENWPATSRLRPVFLPWFVGSDIYPTDTWLRQHPIPDRHQFESITIRHAERAAAYVQSNELLRRYLGDDWRMAARQMWFWEATRGEYQAQGALGKFLAELCVAGGTKISTRRGIVPIEHVEVGDITSTGTVEAVHANGIKDTFRLETKKGRIIIATEDHRFALTNGNWKELSGLKVGDHLVLNPPNLARHSEAPCFCTWQWANLCTMQIMIEETWARFLGYFMGDGSYHSDRVMIACDSKDQDVIEDAARVLEEIIGKPPTRMVKGGMTLLTSASIRWWEMLNALGCLQPAFHKNLGRNCGWKRKVKVPDCIWKSSKRLIREFISALFECDGHGYKFTAQTTFSAKDPEFMADVQLLLLGFGINSYNFQSDKVNGEGRHFIGRSLRLNAIASDLFHERIDFIGKRKRSARRRCLTLGRKADPHVMEDEVRSIEPAGKRECFDLTMEGEASHCYGANGILVHNCSDDIEAFQHDKHNPFGVELISQYHNATSQLTPRVYGFQAREDIIPARLQPDRRDIDTDQAPIYCKPLPNATSAAPRDVKLVRLKWHGMNAFDPLGKLLIWKDWERGSVYGNGVDTAYGIGRDRSVIETLRKGTLERSEEQCAEFASPYVNANDLAPIAYVIGTLYSSVESGFDSEGHVHTVVNQCHQAIEVQANGEITQLELRKMGWTKFHHWVRYDRRKINPSKADRVGWATVPWSRALLMSGAIKYLRDGWVDINSPWFVEEMQALVQDDQQQSMKAEYGEFDDRFMAFGIILAHFHLLEMNRMGPTIAEQRVARRAMDDPLAEPESYSFGAQSQPVYGGGIERMLVEAEETW